MALPTSEWLHLAQRLAVGQSSRAYHKNETTPALTIKNLPDRWTAYCHRCRQAAVQLKTHAVLGRIPDQHRFMPWPDDARPLEEWPLYEQETIFALLFAKGIDRQVHLAGTAVYYSRHQGRLILGTRLGWIGRATRGQLPKWAGYGYPAPAYAAPCRADTAAPVVLTEDYLSACKVAWASGLQAHACLGTTLRDAHLQALLEAACARVLVMFDGDPAGRKGAVDVARRARGMGLPVDILTVPEGKDPKDLTKEQILNIIGDACGSPAVTGPAQPG